MCKFQAQPISQNPVKIEIVILLPGQLKIALHLLHSVARPSR